MITRKQTDEFSKVNIDGFVGDGHCFEAVLVRSLEPRVREALNVVEYVNCIDTPLDRKGVDLRIVWVEGEKVGRLNIDFTKNCGWKALKVWDKRHFLERGTVFTQCILDAELLKLYQNGSINLRQLLRKGIELWEEIRDLVEGGDLEAVQAYAEQHL